MEPNCHLPSPKDTFSSNCSGFSSPGSPAKMDCLDFSRPSVRYSVLINGTPHPLIQPSSGIRQGDPSAPLIFVACTNVLSDMLEVCNEYSSGTLTILQPTHILYMLMTPTVMGRATTSELQAFAHILIPMEASRVNK